MNAPVDHAVLLCPHCYYDVRGLSQRCSECGGEFTDATVLRIDVVFNRAMRLATRSIQTCVMMWATFLCWPVLWRNPPTPLWVLLLGAGLLLAEVTIEGLWKSVRIARPIARYLEAGRRRHLRRRWLVGVLALIGPVVGLLLYARLEP